MKKRIPGGSGRAGLFGSRAVMLDMARLLERRDYYYSLLPWLREWGYNVLHLHFTDDEGCSMVFPSHPELASPAAFTADEMKDFIKSARRNGLEVIPELETLGHTMFITQNPAYRHLGGRARTKSIFNSIHPRRKGSRALISDLLSDIASVFPCDIIHAGLDEVDMSAFPEYRKLDRKQQWRAFAEHSGWVHEEIRKLGRRPAMWGDHILDTPGMMRKFGSDVLIFDWHYNAPFNPGSLDLLLEGGFEVWGCPSSMHWNERVLPSIQNSFQNMREFSAAAAARKRKGCTGMVNTIWCPWRYLSGVMDFPMAFCGHLFREQSEDPSFAADFAGSFYGLGRAAAAECGRLIWELHEAAPGRERFVRMIRESGRLDREDIRRARQMADGCRRAEKAILACVKSAKRNADRLYDYVISARILRAVAAYGEGGTSRPSAPVFKSILKDCDRSWRSTREWSWDFPDFPKVEWVYNIENLLPVIRDLAAT